LKLSVVALGYENRHYKYIFTGCFLKATASRNHVFLLAVNLRKQPVKINLHWRFKVWTHNFVSTGAYTFRTTTGKNAPPTGIVAVLVDHMLI
jgi:hypothetical protein